MCEYACEHDITQHRDCIRYVLQRPIKFLTSIVQEVSCFQGTFPAPPRESAGRSAGAVITYTANFSFHKIPYTVKMVKAIQNALV